MEGMEDMEDMAVTAMEVTLAAMRNQPGVPLLHLQLHQPQLLPPPLQLPQPLQLHLVLWLFESSNAIHGYFRNVSCNELSSEIKAFCLHDPFLVNLGEVDCLN